MKENKHKGQHDTQQCGHTVKLFNTPEDQKHFAEISDLASRLHFSPSDGRIWLDNRRMSLIDSYALGALRIELIESLGYEHARGMITRMGYACGTRDAQLAFKVRPPDKGILDTFMAGPQLHSLEGLVMVEPVKVDMDVDKGEFYGEFIWRDSSEGEVHINNYGVGAEPVCWMQVGYACGYASVFMGKPILFREIQCSAMGHTSCRIIGKPATQWDNAEQDLQHFRAQPFVNKRVVEMRPSSNNADNDKPDHRSSQNPTTSLITEDESSPTYSELVGISARFSATCHMVNRVANTNATVLFLGETGVGKELFARSLHRVSQRSDKPFIAVNCAAIPDNLIESELFGVEKGAFTGAVTSRPGRFELANDGTLFLDEVGTLSLAAQGKLLRAIQEREIERVGGTVTKRVNVRVCAATNEDMHNAVNEGRFREDLFFRLNIFPIRIPPLRERRDDIPLLMETFLKRFVSSHDRQVTGFSSRAVEGMLSYNWPGNIRELENVIERGVILAPENGSIDLCHLFTYGEKLNSSVFRLQTDGTLAQQSGDDADQMAEDDSSQLADNAANLLLETGRSLDELEDFLVNSAMEKSGGNVSAAARLLGITRSRMDHRLKKIAGAGH